MNPATTVFLIDDHPLMRRGLAALLSQQADLKVVGEAGDAAAALHLLPGLKADVVLLDNHLPGVRGVDAIADLRAASPVSHIVMLTVSDDEADLVAALRAGARGYLLKTMDGGPLADAVRRAARGESVVSPEMMGKLVAAVQAPDAEGGDVPAAAPEPEPEPASPLSAREEDVLREIAAGASNKEIARTLAIAETTVKIHVQHILRKLGLSSRVQAAVYATERGQGR
jgi:two-component system nitrate/nitrite response regulator NarL